MRSARNRYSFVPAIRAPLDYALYIAFFPQLLAGPIVRAERFFGELYNWRRPSADGVLRGIGEIALGLVKKTAIADQLATVADAYFRDPSAHPFVTSERRRSVKPDTGSGRVWHGDAPWVERIDGLTRLTGR